MVVNATGWTELMAGHMISASFAMYNEAFAGWTVAFLFIVYQLMLYMKTRNLTLCWVTGLFFASLYGFAKLTEVVYWIKPMSMQVIFVILVLELAGILYMWFFK